VPADSAYELRCFGGGFEGTATASVRVGSANVEVDFISGRDTGEIDFALQTAPKPRLLSLTKATVKVAFKKKEKPSKYKVKLKGEFDLPEGYEHEGRCITVHIGDIFFGMTLDANGQAKDRSGNKFSLVAANGRGTFTAKLKGAMAAALDPAGLKDHPASSPGVPLAVKVLVDDRAWRSDQTYAVKGKFGKKWGAKLE
jgi:hypothetical protein